MKYEATPQPDNHSLAEKITDEAVGSIQSYSETKDDKGIGKEAYYGYKLHFQTQMNLAKFRGMGIHDPEVINIKPEGDWYWHFFNLLRAKIAKAYDDSEIESIEPKEF